KIAEARSLHQKSGDRKERRAELEHAARILEEALLVEKQLLESGALPPGDVIDMVRAEDLQGRLLRDPRGPSTARVGTLAELEEGLRHYPEARVLWTELGCRRAA